MKNPLLLSERFKVCRTEELQTQSGYRNSPKLTTRIWANKKQLEVRLVKKFDFYGT